MKIAVTRRTNSRPGTTPGLLDEAEGRGITPPAGVLRQHRRENGLQGLASQRQARDDVVALEQQGRAVVELKRSSASELGPRLLAALRVAQRVEYGRRVDRQAVGDSDQRAPSQRFAPYSERLV